MKPEVNEQNDLFVPKNEWNENLEKLLEKLNEKLDLALSLIQNSSSANQRTQERVIEITVRIDDDGFKTIALPPEIFTDENLWKNSKHKYVYA